MPMQVDVAASAARGRPLHGRVVVGLVAVSLSELPTDLSCGVTIKAPGKKEGVKNKRAVWVGGKDVTEGNGLPLSPGNFLTVPARDVSSLFAISTLPDQHLTWLGI